MTEYIVTFDKPKGMTFKDFQNIVKEIERKRGLLSVSEKKQCQELLKTAGIKKSLAKGSLNYHVKNLLNSGFEVTSTGREVTELHMKINALPMFLEIVLHDELYKLSQKEVAENEAFIRSKGYMDCDDDPHYWQKRVWSDSQTCKVILISKGVGENTNQFYRIEAVFKKGQDMPIEEKQPVYSQYLRDLVI